MGRGGKGGGKREEGREEGKERRERRGGKGGGKGEKGRVVEGRMKEEEGWRNESEGEGGKGRGERRKRGNYSYYQMLKESSSSPLSGSLTDDSALLQQVLLNRCSVHTNITQQFTTVLSQAANSDKTVGPSHLVLY